MNDFLKVAIPASIALLGTLIVAFLGYRQWKKQQDVSRYGSFLTDKQTAYKTIWEKLEEIHIRFRAKNITQAEFDKLLHSVNAYILKQDLYLEADFKETANQYLEKMYSLHKLIKTSGDETIKRDWAISIAVMVKTDEIEESLVGQAREIRRLQYDVTELRNEIILHCRKIIGGSLI